MNPQVQAVITAIQTYLTTVALRGARIFDTFHTQTFNRFKTQASKDANNNVPTDESVLNIEQGIKNHYRNSFTQLVQAAGVLYQQGVDAVGDMIQQLQQADSQAAIIDKYNDAERQVLSNTDDISSHQSQIDTIDTNYQQATKRLGRNLSDGILKFVISPLSYVGALLIFALAEIIVNTPIFYWALDSWFTALSLAIILSLAVLLCCHFLAFFLKRTMSTPLRYIAIPFFAFIIIVCCSAPAWVRADVLSERSTLENSYEQDAYVDNSTLNFDDTEIITTEEESQAWFYLLLAISFGLALGATIFSYKAIESDQQMHGALKDKHITKPKLEAKNQKLVNSSLDIKADRDKDITQLRRSRSADEALLINQCETIIARTNQIVAYVNGLADQFESGCDLTITEYRLTNQAHRKPTSDVPANWAIEPIGLALPRLQEISNDILNPTKYINL